jgi:hypothetical protein
MLSSYAYVYRLYYFQHTSYYNLIEGVGNENPDLINFGNRRDFRIYHQKNCTVVDKIIDRVVSHKAIG